SAFEQTDDAGNPLGVAFQFFPELIARQPGGQRARLEVGRDDGENVMMRREASRRTRPAVDSRAAAFLATRELAGFLAQFALGKAGDVRLDIVREQVMRAESALPLPIGSYERKAFCGSGRVRPFQLGRHILPDAVRIGL